MERLAREKIATQQRLAELKHELSQWMDVLEIDRVLRQTGQPEDDQASTSTASGKPQPSAVPTTFKCCPQLPWAGFTRKDATCPSPIISQNLQGHVCLQPLVSHTFLTCSLPHVPPQKVRTT